VELYDVKKDPHQLKNIFKDVSPKFLAAKLGHVFRELVQEGLQ